MGGGSIVMPTVLSTFAFLSEHGISDLLRARHQDLNFDCLQLIRHDDGTH
jgi:hypothetical protein